MQLLEQTKHRPYPLSSRPWMMTQTWNRLLFAHWPVPISLLQPYIPSAITMDTYDGTAWISVIPFEISHLRARGLPPIPFTTYFPEINVRTYVVKDNKPGVFLFSLDATNPLAVTAARAFFYLPYYNANIQVVKQQNSVHYKSQRTHKNAPTASFSAQYRPTSPIFQAPQGSLDDWLTARYCLYTYHKNQLYRGEIHHAPWPMQQAEAEISNNAMHPLLSSNILQTQPILHYVHQITALFWLLEKI
ncbi:MAG: DUF2071 domain-containing protein [Paenibacillaceae bacterium]